MFDLIHTTENIIEISFLHNCGKGTHMSCVDMGVKLLLHILRFHYLLS